MSQVEPKTTKGVVQDKKGGKPYYGEIQIPELQEGDLLINVHGAPIHSVDVEQLYKTYNIPKEYPATAGMEGSGVVLKANGENLQHLVGKKVSFVAKFGQNLGTYGEYSITTEDYIIKLSDDFDLDNGACGSGNPLTTLYMYEKAKELGAKALVVNAANSAIGKQIARYCPSKGMEVISIVRREGAAKQLEDLGIKNVLVSSDKDFSENLKKLCEEKKATVFYDLISGQDTPIFMQALPQDSHFFHAGRINPTNKIEYDLSDLLWGKKTIGGFNMAEEAAVASKEKKDRIKNEVEKNVGDSLSTDVIKKFGLEDFEKAIDYYNEHKEGKVLLSKIV